MTGLTVAGIDQCELPNVSAGLGTYAGARLVTLEDGVERGIRVIEMRSGGGLDFDITVDRSGDIGRLSCDGQTVSWHAASGLTSPWLMNHEGDEGQGFLRGFGGFLNTCGLDHIRQPERDKDEVVNQDHPFPKSYPLHGKGTFQPATIRGYGLIDDVDQPYAFCEIEFVQAMNFSNALRLRRRIECPIGSRSITIRDRVRNVGNDTATHMLLYHFNLGFPLVAPGTNVQLGDDECVWRSEKHDPVEQFPAPTKDAFNKISIFKHTNEMARIRVENPNSGLTFEIAYPSEQLPYCQLLRMTSPGIYGVGIEPCTSGTRSRQEARQADEMILLQPSEEREYYLSLNITKPEN